MCFNHVNTCKFWATRILVGMKKKRLCTDTSAQSHLLYLNPWSSYCLCHTAQQPFVFTLSSVLFIIHNLISPKEWKHSIWILLFIDKLFFVNSLLFGSVGCSQFYIRWRDQRFCQPGFQPWPCDWWMTSVPVRTETRSTWIPVAKREEQYWPTSCSEVSYALTV